MPFGLSLQDISHASGWTVATVVLCAMLYGMVKGIVVPRFLYEEQRLRADRAIEEQEQALDSVERLTKAVDTITDALLVSKVNHE